MIFDKDGFPKDSGAWDFQDSARLAGIMTIFEYPIKVDLSKYVVDKKYYRHPTERRYDFSRDQALPLLAGLHKQGRYDLVNRDYITGKDWFSPSHMGHITYCKNKEPNWFQQMWLWFDVLWGTFIRPTFEPNQLLSKMMVAKPCYLKFWLKHNRKWREAITGYWSGWRGESDLAKHMINYLENI